MGLEIKNLSKSFNGKIAVDNISFKITKPSALGLVGLNGAGKTTSIRMIIDILKKDSGEVLWNGKTFNRNEVKIGYLPEERGIYPKIKVRDQLLYFAKLKGMSDSEAIKALESWAKRIDIVEYLDRTAEELSKGNQQKVQLLTALIHNPDLIILDEPLSGLDPINAELIKDILNDMIKKGKYIIFTSHQMNVIEEFCTDLVMLAYGKIVMSGNLEEIKKEYTKDILCVQGEKKLKDYLINNYDATINDIDEIEIKLSNRNQMNDIFKKVVNESLNFQKFELKTPTLREIFIEKAGEDNERL